ncbi:MAG TPA: hypothetical protein ENJ37_09160 [Deltaproteobacteria bacterium]|nr:hypothetical protein [Deltaproteobacteria bacterium]
MFTGFTKALKAAAPCEREVFMDPVRFSGEEILEMAVKIEENGLKFYTDAAGAAGSDELRAVFEYLAEEERRHVDSFLAIKARLTGKKEGEGVAGVFNPYIEEVARYLRAIADTKVFTRPAEGARLAAEAGSDLDAVKKAMDMEKDSLLFYYELQKALEERDRAVVEELIAQERNHLKRLIELEEELTGRR